MAFDINAFLAKFPNSKITSAYKSLNLKDWQIILIMSFFTPFLTGIIESLEQWLSGAAWVINWWLLLKVSIAAFAVSFRQLFFTPATIHIPVTDAQQAVDEKVMEPTAK